MMRSPIQSHVAIESALASLLNMSMVGVELAIWDLWVGEKEEGPEGKVGER